MDEIIHENIEIISFNGGYIKKTMRIKKAGDKSISPRPVPASRFRNNLRHLQAQGIRYTSRFTQALKNSQHPLGYVFRRYDLKKLETRGAKQLVLDLASQIIRCRIRDNNDLRGLLRQAYQEAPDGSDMIARLGGPDKAFEDMLRRAEESDGNMSPGKRQKGWEERDEGMRRLEEASEKEGQEPGQITKLVRNYMISVATGTDGRLTLDIQTKINPLQVRS